MSLICQIVLVIAGLTFEILGVFRMASQSTRIVRLHELPTLLISAFFRGSAARAAVEAEALNEEDRLTRLQGLAFLGFGFLLQTIGFVWTALSARVI